MLVRCGEGVEETDSVKEHSAFMLLHFPRQRARPSHQAWCCSPLAHHTGAHTHLFAPPRLRTRVLLPAGAPHGSPPLRWGAAESATEFLLRCTITNPDMHTTIVGTLNPAHLHENIAAVLQGPLPAAVYHEAKRRLAAARAILA